MAKTDAKADAKLDPKLDVLVLGEHPATYLCAALLKHTGKLRVLHATIPDERPVERTCALNPAFFSLHKLLEPLKRKLDLTAVYGVQFLADDPETRSECRGKATTAYCVNYKDMRQAMIKLAADEGVEMVTPKQLQIHRLDEKGLEVTLGRGEARPKALVLGGRLPDAQQKLLGLPDSWGPDVVHRYTFLRLKGNKWADLGGRPTLPMSLDLRKELMWAWLLPFDGGVQIAVDQPIETVSKVGGVELLRHWAETLRKHNVLKGTGDLPLDAAEALDLPLAGALAHEGVANRTLLIGPAGGFYSATGEDLYPNCWSAIYAADVLKKAMKEPHLQDAIQPYRQRWRTTLGDYLRGPQQNLRFLLPLVYRNQVMTDRLSDSILLGKGLVR
jgi:flavin-dependent dehydrogenase